MELAEIKKRLRRLKRIEIWVRFGGRPMPAPALFWTDFFSFEPGQKVKYPLEQLLGLEAESDDYRRIVDEYMAYVYSEYFQSAYFSPAASYDKKLLARLELPADADEHVIKRRFRELAKLYHPDTGGRAEDFIELVRIYRQLTGDPGT